MLKKGTIHLIFLLFLMSNSFAQDSTSVNKINPSKSWGLGINYGTSNYIYGIGLTLFYQKNRNQFDLNLFSNYTSGVDLKYSFYPNDFNKKFDLRVEILVSINHYRNIYNSSTYPFTNYRIMTG